MELKLLAIIMIIGLMLVLMGASALSTQLKSQPTQPNNDDGLIHGNGTVVYLGFEGGFYGIKGDDGENYDPLNMPQEFMVDGLRVQFTANLTNYVSYHMWGYIVKLFSIKRLS